MISRRHILPLLLFAALPVVLPAQRVTPEECYTYLKRWEGYSTTVYRDGPGYSVGVGHYLGSSRPRRLTYSHAEIRQLFYRDLAIALAACERGVEGFSALPRQVQLVTLGVAWSVGPTGFMRFKEFRRALNWRAYEGAATELADSKWARQVGAARYNHAIGVLKNQW